MCNRSQYREYPKHLISSTRPPLCKSERRSTLSVICHVLRSRKTIRELYVDLTWKHRTQLDRKLFWLRRKKLCIFARIIRLFTMPRLEYGKHQSFNSDFCFVFTASFAPLALFLRFARDIT